MVGIRNSNSGIIRAYFERRRQTRDWAAPTLSFLICLLRLPDGQNKKAWHQGLRKDSKSKRGRHQSTDLWKVMIISQKHWQWTFSVSKSEGDMSPLVIIFAGSCQSLQSGGNRKNSAAFGRFPPLDVDGALYGWFAYLLAFLLLIWYEWVRLGCFWNGDVKFSQTAGPGEMLAILSMNLLGRKATFQIMFSVGAVTLHVLAGTQVWVCPASCPEHIPTGSPFMLLSALFGSCILKEKNGSITFTDCEDEDLVKKTKTPPIYKNLI